AVELKRSGVLGLLKTIAGAGESLTALALSDAQVFRALALLQALTGGLARLEPGDFAEARMNAEDSVECLLRGLQEADPAKTPRVGVAGLLSALRDPKVQRGLGFLVQLARGLGGCLESKASRGS
ncbi:MAG: DUF1641 domain-containing protein, partial [Desulfurococcales archaeon]|nr:DUF1641 domain-containing protein [Desulfurococcales archaeon]